MATTNTEMEKMSKTAEQMAKTTQQSAYTAMDYALKAQEVNTELLRKTTEVWIEGVRKQTDLSGHMAQEFSEKAENQIHAYQDFFGQWGFPSLMSFPLVRMPYYDPFGIWKEWTQSSSSSVGKAVHDTQMTAAKETARVIETTAPTSSATTTLPIAGYDNKSVGEIASRLETLTSEQLERLKDYEGRNKNRETLIREIDRRIGAAS